MKVWEKCNEVKETEATVEEITSWAYGNRICPLMFDARLEIDIPLDEDGYPIDNGFLRTARKVCEHNNCRLDCLKEYLNSEYIDIDEKEN